MFHVILNKEFSTDRVTLSVKARPGDQFSV